MQLNITFRHLEPIDSLKNYAREKVERAHKYLDKAGDAHVVLSLERHLHQLTETPIVLGKEHRRLPLARAGVRLSACSPSSAAAIGIPRSRAVRS